MKNSVQTQTRLAPSRRAELVADYAAGMPVRAISAKYGVHRGTIPELVRREGMAIRMPGLDVDEQARAASLYGIGMTLAHVALRMGVSDEAVRKAVLADGRVIRPRGRRPQPKSQSAQSS